MNSKAEEIRIRYLYRDLVLRGKLRVPLEAAKRLVGPDCAYRLYSAPDPSGVRVKQKQTDRKAR